METRDIALIKALSNGAGGASYTLPIASATQLGGVKPVTKTEEMTQPCGVDEAGGLWTAPGSGGGGEKWELLADETLAEDVTSWSTTFPKTCKKIRAYIFSGTASPNISESNTWLRYKAGSFYRYLGQLMFISGYCIIADFFVDLNGFVCSEAVSTTRDNSRGASKSSTWINAGGEELTEFTKLELESSSYLLAGVNIKVWGVVA